MLLRSLFSVVCLTLSSWSLAAVVAKEYPVKDFSEIVVAGETELEISQTGKEYLRIEADEEVMKHVKVDQTGKRISVWAKHDGNFFSWFGNHDSMRIKVIVQVKNLEHLELSGAANATVGDLKTPSLFLGASGAANGNFSSLNANYLKGDFSGAANLRFETLNSTEQEFDLSGASNLDVKDSGNTTKLAVDASGASNFRAKNLTAIDADLNASGASHIDVGVSGSLDAEASGASGINYYGDPKSNTRATGASSINAHD